MRQATGHKRVNEFHLTVCSAPYFPTWGLCAQCFSAGRKGREEKGFHAQWIIGIKTIILFLGVAHKHGKWVIRKDVQLANKNKAISSITDKNIVVRKLSSFVKIENYAFVLCRIMWLILHFSLEKCSWSSPPKSCLRLTLWRASTTRTTS